MAKKTKRQAEFVKWMSPLLAALRALGGSGSPREVSDLIASNEKVEDAILEETTKSGATRFHNQVAWARQYLVWEGLVSSSKKGTWTLTEKGEKSQLTFDQSRAIFLKWVETFSEARKNKNHKEAETEISTDVLDVEKSESVYNPTLIEVLQSLSPEGFERVCQRLLRECGFDKVLVTGRSHDGGIDGTGILQLNPFVSLKIIFQCKRYKGTVSRAQVGDLRNAMFGRAEKAIMITTGTFSQDAMKEASREGAPPIELVDGEKLVSLFERVELGLQPKTIYEVDLSFFQQFMPQ